MTQISRRSMTDTQTDRQNCNVEHYVVTRFARPIIIHVCSLCVKSVHITIIMIRTVLHVAVLLNQQSINLCMIYCMYMYTC